MGSLTIRRLIYFLLVAATASARTEVRVRGSFHGATVRVAGRAEVAAEVLRPSPATVVLVLPGETLATATVPAESPWLRSVRVLGPEDLGASESRVLVQLSTGGLEPRLERDGDDLLLVLEEPSEVEKRAAAEALKASEAAAAAAPPAAPIPTVPAEAEGRAERPERDAKSDERAAARQEARERSREEREEREERRRARRAEDEAAASGTADEDRAGSGEERPKWRERREARDATKERAAAARAAEEESKDEPRRPRRSEAPHPADERAAEARAAAESSLAAPSRGAVSADGMVRIPAGEFLMGVAEGSGFADEDPEHPVRLREFEIDRLEVTVAQFEKSPFTLPRQPEWNWGPDQPVVGVTWEEADQYCSWAGKRLPTEAEWEKAARGTQALLYPWGKVWSVKKANSAVDGDGWTHASPVGSFPEGASPYGVEDMAGNVWEWVADWYGEEYYAASSHDDPAGPARGSRRVARGGSFLGESSFNVRTTVRQPTKASVRSADVGFRCAR